MRQAVVTITFDSSYPTGGESFTPADLGFTAFHFVSDAADTARTRVVTAKYDYTNSKLQCFYEAASDSVYAATTRATTATEIGSTYNLSTWTAKLFISGN